MTNEDHFQGCGSVGYCGACPTPCFLLDRESFESLIEQGPDSDSYDGLSEDMGVSDANALGCERWDDPLAVCDIEACVSNFFCFDDYPPPEGDD